MNDRGAAQDEIFLESEADRWFERNQGALEQYDPASDPPLRILDLYALAPASVVEIGAATGFRLAAINDRFGSRAVGVEPSAEAIAIGRQKYPSISFVQGTAASPNLEGSFDLVIVNWVLCVVDRANLLRSVAAIDSLVKEGGFLLVGDFDPPRNTRVRYHHLPGEDVFTYKQDYGAVFLASGLYRRACFLASDHSSKAFTIDVEDRDRAGTWLLEKRGSWADSDLTAAR